MGNQNVTREVSLERVTSFAPGCRSTPEPIWTTALLVGYCAWTNLLVVYPQLIDSVIALICAIYSSLNRAVGLQMFAMLHIAVLVAWKEHMRATNSVRHRVYFVYDAQFKTPKLSVRYVCTLKRFLL